MIDLLRELGTAADRQGSGVTRLWANMVWGLEWGLLDFLARTTSSNINRA